MSYGRFFAMIATSTVAMFGLMYLNTYIFNHIYWSETRAYMALLMGATMAIIMLGFMLTMYSKRVVNIAIFAGSAIVFGVSLWLVRSQITIEDEAYMRAMIPHHSIAIMTSSRANISDPRVRKLADEIIYAQDKEIAEMRYLIAELGTSREQPQSAERRPARIGTLEEALTAAETANLDAEFMTEEEIGQFFPGGRACVFTYTENSPAVLAAGPEQGATAALVKLRGSLVRLEPDNGGSPAEASNLSFSAKGVATSISDPGGGDLSMRPAERQQADMVLEFQEGPEVGYRGYWYCRETT